MLTEALKCRTLVPFLVVVILGTGGGSRAPFPGPGAAFAQVRSVEDARNLLTADLHPDALEIGRAMKAAKRGERIVLRGYVAMSKDAFDDSRSAFMLVDEAMRQGEVPDAGHLPDSESIPESGRARIEVVDPNGATLRESLRGRHGLRPGAEVFVTGRVAAADGATTLVVQAISLHVPRSPMPPNIFRDAPPDSARDISEARKGHTLKVGEAVVLRGRIGGGAAPFVQGRAAFTLVGRGLKPCNEVPGDKCARPWDYCCETRADILAHSVSVQVVDASGQVLRTGFKGRRGLKELSEVVVVGEVASSEGGGVVVNARELHIVE